MMAVVLTDVTVDIIPRLADPAFAGEWVAMMDERVADLENCLRLCVTQLEKAELFVEYGYGPLREPATINSIETARHLLRKSPTE